MAVDYRRGGEQYDHLPPRTTPVCPRGLCGLRTECCLNAHGASSDIGLANGERPLILSSTTTAKVAR